MRVLMLKFSGAALFCVFLLFVSACGNKMPDETKQIAKAQKVYDKKGLDGFYEYVKNGGMYFAVKDCQKRFFAVFLCEEHDKIADRVTASIMGMMILVVCYDLLW